MRFWKANSSKPFQIPILITLFLNSTVCELYTSYISTSFCIHLYCLNNRLGCMLLYKSCIMLKRCIPQFCFQKTIEIALSMADTSLPQSDSPGHPFLELGRWDPQCALEFARSPQNTIMESKSSIFLAALEVRNLGRPPK